MLTTEAASLTPEQHAEAEQVARRLHAELREAIALLPESQRGASAMARGLSIDRATCQRIVAAAVRPQVGPEMLVQIPGVQGLRQFVSALAGRKGARAHSEQLAATSAAIDRFEELISQLAGSQRQLKMRLGLDGWAQTVEPPPMHGGADDLAARESLFRAAAGITGRWSETLIDVRIIRPVPGLPLLTEGLRVRGMIGHVSRRDAVPLEMGGSAPLRAQSPPGPAFSTLGAQPASGTSLGSLLPEFCSAPLPRVTSRSADDRVIHVIDTDGSSPERPVDIMLAQRGAQSDRHPASLRPALGEMWLLVTFPARRVVYDVYLHREIARRCIPSLELHLWGPDMGRHGSSRWSTRFPGGPRLEVLSSGIAGAATNAYPRHPALLQQVISEVGWSGDDFVGYRCEVHYPVWRAGYCMVFDFTGNEVEAPQ